MNFQRFVTATVLALATASEAHANANAIEKARNAHREAMEALEDCRSAWTQDSRRAAAKTIEEKGVYLALSLNPISRYGDEQGRMLEEVTAALKECAAIAYPES